MLRLLRISGIFLFAILIGIAASRLQEQHRSGTLWNQYNSQRKADVTLLVVSIVNVSALGFFEFLRSKRHLERRGYMPVEQDEEPQVAGLDSTSIYSAPETIDKWQGRRLRSKSKPHKHIEMNDLWMGLLRIYCIVTPLVYLYILADYLINWLPSGAGYLIFTILFPALLLFSILTSVGIFRKKMWGMNCGYGMAIIHLLIFPVGTVAGLVMLVGLVGAAPEFVLPARERRREMRKRMQSAPV